MTLPSITEITKNYPIDNGVTFVSTYEMYLYTQPDHARSWHLLVRAWSNALKCYYSQVKMSSYTLLMLL